MIVFYVHGFASSARSTKAAFFAERLGPYGIEVRCPDLNEPDFSTLTVTRMIDRMQAEIAEAAGEPVTLIGSSLGAFVAVLTTARVNVRAGKPLVSSLVLLAPALEFGANRMRHLGEEGIARWRDAGTLDVFHYGYGKRVPVGYGLYEDASKHDAFAADVRVPILIFQGLRDELVDPVSVERYALGRPNVDLRLLDDDHQLLSSLEYLWRETAAFLELAFP
jgi:pimeloyl-ACP methyl ester carboxylesterase